MTAAKMHADELDIDASLVRHLLERQFPHWAKLPLTKVASAGTDNTLFRLGEEMVVRLPRIEWAVEPIQREQEWLPKLASLLPFALPVPIASGQPDEDYPWPWSIAPWLEGKHPSLEQVPSTLPTDLAHFVKALQSIDPEGGPPSFRSERLETRDERTRKVIDELHGIIDTDAVTEIWERTLELPGWSGSPVWIHSDLAPGNLLLVENQLSAIIDFSPGLGDPACDLIVAWNLLPKEMRNEYRLALHVDDATWLRGRGWALSIALLQLPYYLHTNPIITANAKHVISEILEDHHTRE
ncbi:MAG: phosphotransferase [Chloroflexi bacterium]|nr:MAG: phosphotransferase [Chloroflexota bacterium]MBL1196754.1 aminoglycoside phosphotransferase family protein [Chloroflexota bacterium]NOH14048.1 aminoglycoside phosphotransferase family protein [Chloroflexota bacterium]